jgi:hypothetical protein
MNCCFSRPSRHKSALAKLGETGVENTADGWSSVRGHAEQCVTWTCRNVKAVCDGLYHSAAGDAGGPKD